jgi:hypothetical protein
MGFIADGDFLIIGDMPGLPFGTLEIEQEIKLDFDVLLDSCLLDLEPGMAMAAYPYRSLVEMDGDDLRAEFDPGVTLGSCHRLHLEPPLRVRRPLAKLQSLLYIAF